MAIVLTLLAHIVVTFAMMVAVVCFETDCKKIIFWSLIICVTSIVGFGVYILGFCDNPGLKKSVTKKFELDGIYKKLIGFSVNKTASNNDTLNFNKRHYLAEIFKNSSIKVIDNLEAVNDSIMADLEKAKHYIIINSNMFLSVINNENAIALLKEKQAIGVNVKCVYDKRKFADKKTIRLLRASGVRVARFNKHNKYNRYYKNNKNIISIDGDKVYICNSFEQKAIDKPVSCSCLFYKVEGEILRAINIDCAQDVTFATQKFYELKDIEYEPKGDTEMQYVTNVADKDLEGVFLKALNDAKKRVIIHISKFIPTPSIKQVIQMLVMSGVDVKIMIAKKSSSYYASRAYLKEMAMLGASAHIYDGVIGANFMVIDNLTFVGNFSLVNLEIRNNLQNLLIINNTDFSNKTQLYFNEMINNSYRICKPKNVLFREKVFKKFN